MTSLHGRCRWMVRPKSAGAERWASQRNGVQGDWCVPKARDAPATKKSISMGTKSLLREKSNNMEVRCEGVEGATAKPPPRLRRGEPPATKITIPLVGESCCINKSTALLERPAVRSRSCARQYEAGRKSYLGAHLRMRKVTGRDASLPAPWLATSFGAVARERVGALPQTPQGSSAP